MIDFVVLGCGSIGTRHIANLEALGQHVVAVADPSLPNGTERTRHGPVRSYSGPEECLQAEAKDRAVIIASPSKFHGIQALMAVDNGCRALLIEKPMTILPGEAKEVAEACKTYGVRAAVGHNFRFHKAYSEYMSRAKHGLFPYLVWAASDAVKTWPSWQRPDSYLRDPENGGILYSAASHCVDMAIALNGPAEAVLCRIHGSPGESEQTALMRLVHRTVGNSTIVMTWSDRCYSVLTYVDTAATWAFDMHSELLKPSMDMMHRWQMEAFMRYLSGGERGLLCSPEEGHETVLVLASAALSSARNEVVHIEREAMK